MLFRSALVTSGFNRTRAADALGISRVTLYKKMKKYGLLPSVSSGTIPLGDMMRPAGI